MIVKHTDGEETTALVLNYFETSILAYVLIGAAGSQLLTKEGGCDQLYEWARKWITPQPGSKDHAKAYDPETARSNSNHFTDLQLIEEEGIRN